MSATFGGSMRTEKSCPEFIFLIFVMNCLFIVLIFYKITLGVSVDLLIISNSSKDLLRKPKHIILIIRKSTHLLERIQYESPS